MRIDLVQNYASMKVSSGFFNEVEESRFAFEVLGKKNFQSNIDGFLSFF